MAEIEKEEILYLKEVITDSLRTILKFAGYSEDNIVEARSAIDSYMDEENEEKKREYRKSLNEMFFAVYKACVLKALEAPGIHPVILMFLLFGYMDEHLAGLKNALVLCKLVEAYDFNPNSNIKSLYEWLTMIYHGSRMPSVNDMSIDYEADLREKLKDKDITQKEYDELLNDKNKKLIYELNNVISIMKRVSGSPTRFLAIFEGEALEYPLNKTFTSNRMMNEELDKIMKVDVNLFAHEYTYANRSAGLENVRILKEVKPDIILLPIIGSRPMMWQEIEGRNRHSAARFFFPRFLNGDLRTHLLRCCGAYRWEYCKREQGARWQDVSDPSLCAYYNYYVQSYKKNHHLTKEQKERVSAQYNKHRHKITDMFVEDYCRFVMNEAEGNIRLNRVSREIFLRFCILNKEIREELVKNSLYTQYINQVNNRIEHEKKQIQVIKKRIEDSNAEIPPEIAEHELLYNR